MFDLHPKVKAAAVAGILVTGICLGLKHFAHIDVPQPVQDGAVVVATFIAGYMVPS